MRKEVILGLSAGVLSVMLLSLASAYYFPTARTFVQDIFDSYVQTFEPILAALFGGFGWSGLYLFERFLLFILLVSVIYVVSGRVPVFENNRAVRWVIAIVVPLIGMRFLDFEQLSTILLSYKITAIALSAVLPLIAFFFFVHAVGKEYPHVRKILWVLFLGVYLGLWSTAMSDEASVIYFWTGAVALLFLLFDGRIQKALEWQEQRRAHRYWKADIVARLREDIRLLHGSGLPNAYKLIERKEKEIERLLKSD